MIDDWGVVQVAAVMGPSGAGKTTFLNALMGTVKYGTISGQVWVNGRAMKMSRLRRIMGFVPQVLLASMLRLPCPALPCHQTCLALICLLHALTSLNMSIRCSM